MFHKYLKFILLSTVLIQASPKAFDSLGNNLEAFQEECKSYKKITSLPAKIKTKCKIFNAQVNSAFKVGYQLDPYIDSDNMNVKKFDKYLTLLRKLDKNKEDILDLMYSEITKARKRNNPKYYSQLVANDKIRLYSVDYKYMGENKNIFGKNERYISHIKYLEALEEAQQATIKQNDEKQIGNHTKRQEKTSSTIKKDYFITSIKKMEVYEKNTDSDPLNDDVEIYIIFGNSKGKEVRPPDGMAFDYSLTINKYNDSYEAGPNGILGQQLASSKGKLISVRGFTSIFIKLPQLTTSTRILTQIQVKLPNGNIIVGKDKDNFNPNRH